MTSQSMFLSILQSDRTHFHSSGFQCTWRNLDSEAFHTCWTGVVAVRYFGCLFAWWVEWVGRGSLWGLWWVRSLFILSWGALDCFVFRLGRVLRIWGFGCWRIFTGLWCLEVGGGFFNFSVEWFRVILPNDGSFLGDWHFLLLKFSFQSLRVQNFWSKLLHILGLIHWRARYRGLGTEWSFLSIWMFVERFFSFVGKGF